MSAPASLVRRAVPATALAAAILGILLTAGPASGVTPAHVATEAALRAAFSDPSRTDIVLGADVSLSDCTATAGQLARPAGSASLTVTGGGHTIRQTCAGDRVIEDDGGSLTLRHLTVTGGTLRLALGVAKGGGIDATGPLTLDRVRVTANSATGLLGGRGGGVHAGGTLTMTSSTIAHNTAGGGRLLFGGLGGGVDAAAGGTITTLTIDDNVATGAQWAGGRAGGLVADGAVTFDRSTLSGNVAEAGKRRGSGYFGGAAVNADLSVVDSTVTANRAEGSDAKGGGLSASGRLSLVYATVTENSAAKRGANLLVHPGDRSFASVVAEPRGGATDCAGAHMTSAGYSYSDDTTCGFSTSSDHQGAGDPGLSTLGAHGGPTDTQLPSSSSPLVGAIPPQDCSSGPGGGVLADQRGLSRTNSGGCTIGAVEVVAPSGLGVGAVAGITVGAAVLAVLLLWEIRRWRRRHA